VEKISHVLRLAGGCPAFNVIAPIAKDDINEPLAPPYFYLVVDGTLAAAEYIVRRTVWSTPAISFIALPYDVSLPAYLTTLEGFTCSPTVENAKKLVEGIATILRSHTTATAFLMQHAKFPEGTTAADQADKIVESLYAVPLEMARNKTSTYILWNIYVATVPDMPLEVWMKFTAIVRTLAFELHRFGRGTSRLGELQFKCSGCKACDHPTGMCPYPRLPGWFGPSPKAMDANDKTHADFDHTSSPSSSNPASGTGPARTQRGPGRGGRAPYTRK
jgi:hypothetical protein